MEDKQKKQADTRQNRKDKKVNSSSLKNKQKAGKKQKKGEEVDPKELTEPITEKVRKKVPKRKPLGPSGQEWDI